MHLYYIGTSNRLQVSYKAVCLIVCFRSCLHGASKLTSSAVTTQGPGEAVLPLTAACASNFSSLKRLFLEHHVNDNTTRKRNNNVQT